MQEAVLALAKLQGANLRGAKLTRDIDLRRAKLVGVHLRWATISAEADLDGADWGHSCIIREEEQERREPRAEQQPAAFSDCAAIYRQIKRSYQESADYQTAGTFFVREMECRRMQLVLRTPGGISLWQRLARRITRAFWWLSVFTCRHGEDPGRLALAMAGVVLLFALIYGLTGIQMLGDYAIKEDIISPGLAMGPLSQ